MEDQTPEALWKETMVLPAAAKDMSVTYAATET